MGNENGDENPEKKKKNLTERFLGKSSKKHTKFGIWGVKDTVGKESPGFPNL